MAASTGLTLDLRPSTYHEGQVAFWQTKKEAVAALREQRARGLHHGRETEVHRAGTWLYWLWVIAAPDHHEGVTHGAAYA